MNPAWDEDTNDNKDNDCDGRVDEVFAGVLGLYADGATESMSFAWIDPFGDSKGFAAASMYLPTTYIADHQDKKSHVGVAVADASNFAVYQFNREAAVTPILEVLEYEWPDEDAPYFVRSIGAHSDGSYYLAAADRLIHVQADGTWEATAQWACAEEDESHEFCAAAIAIDARTDKMALFDWFGGFAFWTPEDGLDIKIPSDLEAPTCGVPPCVLDAEAKEGGGFYALGKYLKSETEEAFGVLKWDGSAEEIVVKGEWTSASYVPASFAIEGESGDFYISASGGWDSHIWRMTADGEYMAPLYQTGEISVQENFLGVAITWDQDSP